jgi:threonine dehydratase
MFKQSPAERILLRGMDPAERGNRMLTLDMILDAQNALADVARRTPLYPAPKLGRELYIKAENLQLTGSFKLRGAYNKIRSLSSEEAEKGVIACSAGNHAQGIALSSARLGIPAVICMPAGAPISKVEATKSYGAQVVLVPGVYDDAAQEAHRLCREAGYTFAHPFDDPQVIAGQGTIGLEILEQLPEVEQVVVPIGGGGLISGVAFAIKQRNPSCRESRRQERPPCTSLSTPENLRNCPASPPSPTASL